MSDLIDRQAAIDALDGEVTVTGRANAEAVRGYANLICDRIKRLPSVRPGCDEWCTDCKEYDQETHSCPRWNRVIRQTVKDMKKEQPEIIRCRDCKYAVHGECELFLKCNEDPVYVKDDDFCSKAERREE